MSARIPFLACFAFAILFSSCETRKRNVSLRISDPIGAAWRADLKGTDSLLAGMETALRSAGAVPEPASATSLREDFKQARLRYKRREFLWEAAFPKLAERLNGPAQDEIERDCEHSLVKAEGFQVLEDRLYADPVAASREILAVVEEMRAVLADSAARNRTWSDSSLLDAARLELFRLAFIGTTSFDSPAALQSLPETRSSLEGMAEALQARFGSSLRGREALAQFLSRDEAAVKYLNDHPDFAAFDRAAFLPSLMEPLYGAFAALQDSLSVPAPKETRAYSPAASSLFSASAWDLRFFAPPFARHANADQAELGRRLFFDPVLSGPGTRSCAVCHQPDRAFTDGLPKSLAMDRHTPVARNAPTLIQAAFQQGAFADLRAGSLEDQASMVVQNAGEMGGNLDSAARRLNGDPDYARRFQEAFADDSMGQDRDVPATPLRIRRALATYIRTLVSFKSPWDRFVRGDADALTPEARHGFNLFMGKANCAACHFPPLFNGTRPPFFARTDLEVLGVPGKPLRDKPPRAVPDGDSGRMVQDHSPLSLRAFKTPTLRNVEFTAPYMHNGVFATLEQVIDFYDAGGGAGLGLDVPNQTLSSDSLHLDPGEKRALVAFMKALSDTAGTTARPPRGSDRPVAGAAAAAKPRVVSAY